MSARTSDFGPTASRMQRAVRSVRREGYKAALVYALVDAALVAAAVNLLVRVTATDSHLAAVPALDPGLVPAVVGTAAGALALAAEFACRARRSSVAAFEASNPELREALRTARDAASDGSETRMARALYGDVLERLRGVSGTDLVDRRRVSATVLVVLLLGGVSAHVAVTDLHLDDFAGPDGTDAPTNPASDDYDGLRNGDEILGDAEDVSAGDDELDTRLPSSGSGDEESSRSAYDGGEYSRPDEGVEDQQAGYAGDEQLADAELIREYNLAIRNEENE